MRPLHRPMFKYGGPIKEGVMSGIKEPVRKAALVGNSVYPQTGGREHHNILKTIFGWGAKPILGTGASQATKKTVGTEATKGIKSLWQKYGPTWPKATRTGQLGEGPGAWKAGKGFQEMKIPKMERFGKFIKQNPWWTAGGALYGGKPAYELAMGPGKSLVKTAADLAVPDWIYNWETGRWFNPDDTDLKPEDKKILEEKITEKVTKKTAPKVTPKTAEQLRKEQIQKYRDIMDIKSMNQEAAYNSLIEASKHVTESEDFKGDIKSGKLINKIIQGASKMYDKPKATKDAIDTLILKGEIEKDLNKDKNALLDAYRIKQMEALDRAAKEDSLQGDMKAHYLKHNVMPSGKSLASLAIMRGADIVKVANTTEVTNWLNNNEGKDEVDFMEFIIKDPENTVEPGIHVVGSALIKVDENKRLQRVG